MKANLKGLSGIKGLVLLHGEKLAILGIAICTLLFIYYAAKLDRLDAQYQADKLRDQITRTNAAVSDFSWDKAVSEFPEEIRVVKKLDKEAEPKIDSGQYPFRPIDPRVLPPRVNRTDPVLLSAVEPRGTGGSGLLPFLDERVMKERNLARLAEEAQKAKEEQEKLDREQKEQESGQARTRERTGPGEGIDGEYDPEHPHRRPIENMPRAPGAQVMGDERLETAFWAIVVAKIPIKEQLKLYRDAFENSRSGFDPQYDFPRYLGYYVQRAEVRHGQELQWANVDVYDGQGHKMGPPGKAAPVNQGTMTKLYQVVQKEWAAQVPEPVDPRYLEPSGLMAFPLPPLIGREWGSEVTHPDIPLIENAPPVEEEVAPEIEVPTTAEGDDGFAGTGDPSVTGIPRMGGGEFGGRMGGRGGGEEGPRGAYSRPMGGRRGMMGGEGELGRGARFGGEGGMNTTGTLPKGVDSWLLRFIDFTVEPGKKYKYRVRLVLSDANHVDNNPQLLVSSLDSAVRTRQKESAKISPTKRPLTYRLADWSEPTPTVGIPLKGSVRLASVKPPAGKFYDEPSATLLVESFDLDEKGNALHTAKKKDLRRGNVANFTEQAEYVTPDGRSIDLVDSFKFHTGITVVDLVGGEKMMRDMQMPSRVLLLDPSGELYIHTELGDRTAIITFDTIFAKDKKKGGRGAEGEGMFRGEGMRGRGER